MAARTVSELANWDGRLDQHRQNSKWHRSSSGLARDSYHTPLENRPFEIFQPPNTFSDQKRAEQSASRSNLERGAVANSSENVRLSSRVDTTSTPSYGMHHHHHSSLSHSVQNSSLRPSPFIAPSKSSHLTPNSSVHASRVYNSRPSSSRKHAALLQPASATKSEVIDLTLEDTEDELSVKEMLVPNNMHLNDQYADPGPSRPSSSSGRSSPIAPTQSLFTPPPPPRRRTRLFIAVPAFPKGLTKTDYLPMPNHSVVPLPEPTVISTLKDSCLAESSATELHTPPQKLKSKEREHDVVSPRKKYQRRAPPNEAGVTSCASLDAFYTPTRIPLHDPDDYPPLTTLDLATNTRFQFAHAWRGYASRLHETEFDWTFKFRLLGRACIWVQSVDTLSPRIPGTAGYVSNEQLRPWEPVVPESSPQEKSWKRSLDEQTDATESHSVIEIDPNYSSLSDDTLPVSTLAFDPAVSNPILSQSFSSTGVDVEHEMNQYFNGFSDSPNKHILPRQQPAPTYTFPHLLQSARHTQMNSLGLGFPSLELDHRLADTGGHECFLGVPPSPTTADMDSSIALTTDSSFEIADYLTASPSNVFAGEANPPDVWSFEQGEGLLPGNNSPSNNHVPPAALGTIDPSLLGPEQPQPRAPSRPPKDPSPKRRSKLPEPVIYMRRPIDSSTLPLVSGKRSVQIKYRDPEGSPATSSTQSVSKQTSLNPVELPVEPSTNDADDSRRVKEASTSLRKLRDHHTTLESDSDYVPETSKPDPKLKIKIKLKRPNAGDKKSVVEDQSTDAGTALPMTSCHQCRNRSQRPKMLCSNPLGGRICGKRFCNRCILNRYPDITFDEHSAGFMCPACTNTCNCSLCSRNRGEEYVSMRLGGQAASIFRAKVTLVRDAGRSLDGVQSTMQQDADARRSASAVTTPTPEPGALPTQSHFWAHVYGIEGERVGSAFMTREHMQHLQTRGPSAPPPPPPKRARQKQVEKPRRREKKREKAREGPRVFVGRPLVSWKVRGVRDLEPSADADVEAVRQGEEKAQERGAVEDQVATGASRRRRCYIGNPAPLYEPYGRMPRRASATPPLSRCSTPMLDSDRSLTPLSELEAQAAYWPQPDVGECCAWAPPPPPGTIVHDVSSDVPGPVGPLGSGVPGAVSTGTDDAGGQDQGLGSVVGVEVGMDGDGDGDAQGPASTLSEQDVERAINAALTALSIAFPS